ncbi:TPA: RICIN domain-containing protein [Bacillus thuringiensis]|nr:RICIN domain-containing protein [Bacillus cereus]HDR4796346.1 RICIN domain-containing protein [Bacillus cereus]HDR4802294.1 RICIN domain-containing protein [Bacillus cereus]HDR4808199.1 RICIN domain-containing protein [Bacillus cereus]HDR4831064.1 RICIN domain-containing protein [Bacillus cereus]
MTTISLQNTADTKFKYWFIDIDANTGDVILWDHLASGAYWKMTDHGNGTVSLQNTADTNFKGWYLDIDGNTGDVILWDHLASGAYWKMTDHGNGTVSLQNTADTKFKDWYLDIDGNTGDVILWDHLASGAYWKMVEQQERSVEPKPPIITDRSSEELVTIRPAIEDFIKSTIRATGLGLGNEGYVRVERLEIKGGEIQFQILLRYKHKVVSGIPEVKAKAYIEGEIDISNPLSIPDDVKICVDLPPVFGGSKFCVSTKQLAELIIALL